MERWGEKGAAPAPAPGRARRYADQPSFSSTLLDAIYKSMDEPDDAAAAATKKQSQDLHCSYYYKASLAGSYRAGRAVATTPGPHATTSSSSECSSYGGFSSSEAESSQHRRLRPIRTSVAAAGEARPAPAPEKTKKAAKSKPGANIRAKLRDLRKPASPGARLAGFLNAIFNGKRAPATPPSASRAAVAASESACSSASSYSRSCLSKTPSTRGQPKRTVRFLDSDTEAAAAPVPAAGTERRRVQVQVGVVELERMLLHRMETDSDEDDEDDESSDASSDLFDLENFAAVAPAAGGAAAYRDELPVYETTRVVLNRGIGHGHGHGHGYTHGRSTRVV